MTDYYETLQVHLKADAEAIRAAYERLRQRYNPATLEGAADERVELTRCRDELERAFTMLGDQARRAAHDGADISEQSYTAQGLGEAEQALAASPKEPRVLLSAGVCQALSEPPRTQAAQESWQSLVVLPTSTPTWHSRPGG